MQLLSTLKNIELNSFNSNEKIKLAFVVGSGALISTFAFFTIKIYLNHRKYSHIPGSSKKGILGFYFGHALDIFDYLQNGIPFSIEFAKGVEEYGPIVKFNFLDQTIVHTVDAESLKKILVTENFMKNPQVYNVLGYPLGERFIGNSMAIDCNHETWRKKRSIFNQAFHKRELKSYMNEFNLTADALIERLRTMADGKTVVNLYDELSRCAMDMISNIAFGLSLETLNDPNNKLSYYMKTITTTTNDLLLNPFLKFNLKKRPKLKEFKKTLKELREFARQQILIRMEEIRNNENVRNDILSYILKSQENKVEDMDALIDDFISFFFGGHDTTAGTIGFLFQEIGRDSKVYEKLKSEIDSVQGSRTEVLFEELSRLEYTSCVLKETLRLYPAVNSISRYTTEDTIICGYKIPKSTWIIASPYSSQRYSKHYTEPLKFIPERFLKTDENSNAINYYTYFPFSLGPRNCIGQNFAQIEAKVIIAKIIQNFDFVLDKNQSFEPFEALTIKPKDGTKCYLTLRQQ